MRTINSLLQPANSEKEHHVEHVQKVSYSQQESPVEECGAIGLIQDSRHVGFHIVMQISHVLCWGTNIGKKANCGNSARRNIEITLLKVHFRIET